MGLLGVLCVIAGGIFVATGVGKSAAPRRQAPSPAPSAHASPATSSSPPHATPARLRIPAIGVDAAVEQVGLTAQHDMDVPRESSDVGWYKAGPEPGQPGDAVIDGHLVWTSGPAVFWSLGRLRAGDQIQVADVSGRALSFQVTSAASYPANEPPPPSLFSSGGQPRLSLITCAGDWNGTQYDKRLVVQAATATSAG